MKIFGTIVKRILYPACAIFTCLTLLFMLLAKLITDNEDPALQVGSFFMFFVLSILIAACNLIFSVEKYSLFLRAVLHYLAVLASLIVVFTVFGKNTGASPLVLILLYSVLYLVVSIPVLLILASKQKKKREEQTYTSMFAPRS